MNMIRNLTPKEEFQMNKIRYLNKQGLNKSKIPRLSKIIKKRYKKKKKIVKIVLIKV